MKCIEVVYHIFLPFASWGSYGDILLVVVQQPLLMYLAIVLPLLIELLYNITQQDPVNFFDTAGGRGIFLVAILLRLYLFTVGWYVQAKSSGRRSHRQRSHKRRPELSKVEPGEK